MTKLKTWAAAAAMVALSGAAQAALVNRGSGMIYDTVLNVTWLSDMNYAQTSNYDSDGLMDWSTANTWANSLSYGGHDDWTLASIDQLVHLFVTDLGNKSGESVLTQTGDTAEQIANLLMFSGVQSNGYWSGLEYAPDSSYAWGFSTEFGYQGWSDKVNTFYAVAVRPGDVAASVPEPQTLALALLGLGATVVARRRRPR